MLKKILLAMDGSENAERALWWVIQYAGREKAQVVLFRAVDTTNLEPEFLSSQTKDALNYLQRMETEINQAGIPAKVIVRPGRPAEMIVKVAMEERADLILMTTRGGSKVKRWTIGGVTEQVLRMSPIPVLPVQSRTRPAKNDRVRRIIMPVDGSKLAEAAMDWAKGLAHLLKARLVFLHVYPHGPGGLGSKAEENFDALRKRMVRLCQLLRKEGIKARFAVRTGDAADRILAFSGMNDLILTTTHGGGGFKRWIFGSVAEKLIHESRVPVLVFKAFSQIKGKALTA
ncbi:MAG: universal stress protein [Planctomycetes bacterium]|nr:universal stress protein [Planctomycetota bacterium]